MRLRWIVEFDTKEDQSSPNILVLSSLKSAKLFLITGFNDKNILSGRIVEEEIKPCEGELQAYFPQYHDLIRDRSYTPLTDNKWLIEDWRYYND